jgi:hypothetical protein
MQSRYIKRLPLYEKESYIDVVIRCGGVQDPINWQRLIQPHIVASRPSSPDARWNWPWLYFHCGKSEHALKRATSLFCLDVPSTTGQSVPLAMMLLSEGYPSLDGGLSPCIYVWYVASAPTAALRALGVPYKFGMVLETLLDIAIQRSYELGYDGKVGLHADPSGGELLFSKYRDKARMQALNKNTSLTLLRKLKANDGRYFWTDPKLAQSLSNSLDYLR